MGRPAPSHCAPRFMRSLLHISVYSASPTSCATPTPTGVNTHLWWAHNPATGRTQAQHGVGERTQGLELNLYSASPTQPWLTQVHTLFFTIGCLPPLSPQFLPLHQAKFYLSFKAQLKWHFLSKTSTDFLDKIQAHWYMLSKLTIFLHSTVHNGKFKFKKKKLPLWYLSIPINDNFL